MDKIVVAQFIGQKDKKIPINQATTFNLIEN